MQYDIDAENIKCGGCAKTITTHLEEIDGIDSVTVNSNDGRVTVTGRNDLRDALCTTLASLGYPETGSTAGMGTVVAKARSFASCAIGKFS